MDTIDLICFKCAHRGEFDMGCAAFPDGIPNEVLEFNKHSTPLPDQKNEIVFEPIKKAKNDSNGSTTKND
jgi:hypothetical protein